MARKRMEISQLGEFGLIDRIGAKFKLGRESSLCGIGDDAAVIDAGGESILLCTDLLTEGVHFDLSYTPLRHLGYKAVVVNVSDIAAMNGRPADACDRNCRRVDSSMAQSLCVTSG